ncbi:hypothetical protein MMAD_27890 [Mycolicibacterium madagascariense]|uniref:Uncharacterized protein n=2 Tax=Mycolicibacterium madagascariense TaxID=212765 RepID=A0A7I7XH23_9MYCO|nr:hypothetical protein MMAD_27890 [Mycolicibacterium madagascariense]
MSARSLYAVLFYGPPAVAGLTVIGSFFFAKRRWGFLVPLGALILLGVDLAALAAMFRR